LKVQSRETILLWRVKEHLILYLTEELKICGPGGKQRSVCPQLIRREVIMNLPNNFFLAVNKVLADLRLKWYWPGMTSQVRRLVGQCRGCQQAKGDITVRRQADYHLYAGSSWQVVVLDLCGPLPETEDKNIIIIFLTDHFTR